MPRVETLFNKTIFKWTYIINSLILSYSITDKKLETNVTAVTESLVDANDEARQAEVRTELAEALRGIERTIFLQTKWLAGILLGGLAVVVSVVLSRLP